MLLTDGTKLSSGFLPNAQTLCIECLSALALAAIQTVAFSPTRAAPCPYSYLTVQGGNA
jgi:hypothetical protein